MNSILPELFKMYKIKDSIVIDTDWFGDRDGRNILDGNTLLVTKFEGDLENATIKKYPLKVDYIIQQNEIEGRILHFVQALRNYYGDPVIVFDCEDDMDEILDENENKAIACSIQFRMVTYAVSFANLNLPLAEYIGEYNNE